MPYPKKHKGKVFGAYLTPDESKAVDIEIRKRYLETMDKHHAEIDGTILWVLHKEFGFGPKKLRQFYIAFNKETRRLKDTYEMGDENEAWICRKMLKEYGIDLDIWDKEEIPYE